MICFHMQLYKLNLYIELVYSRTENNANMFETSLNSMHSTLLDITGILVLEHSRFKLVLI